ncbi:unnamed protein product [Owenia fusiformis]|uniref:Autophagy-related protein 27 n=1 Tax=Owenia fusiformis TaxID=6347 RepID=A0A8J1XIU6_OWEFU|nr:unnamed protein product [Owenia fusiformis]
MIPSGQKFLNVDISLFRANYAALFITLFSSMQCCLGADPQQIQCTLIDSCSCQSDQGKIDLSPLDTKDASNPAFFNQYDEAYVDQYSFNPCSKFTLDASCTDVAVCQSQQGGAFYPLGTQDSAQFITDPTKGLEIQYSQDWLSVTRTSHVQLLCDEAADTPILDVSGEDSPGSANYYMSLTSKYCCPQGSAPPASSTHNPDDPSVTVAVSISVGTILCIILIVLLPLYVIGGMAIKRQRQGARGVEMVPNIEFWKSVPGLVKDGTMFVVGKVTRKGEYQRM